MSSWAYGQNFGPILNQLYSKNNEGKKRGQICFFE